jgi:amino acid permease
MFSAAGIWLQSMLKAVKSQKKLMFIPLVLFWLSLLPAEKQWTSTGQRASSVSRNGYALGISLPILSFSFVFHNIYASIFLLH